RRPAFGVEAARRAGGPAGGGAAAGHRRDLRAEGEERGRAARLDAAGDRPRAPRARLQPRARRALCARRRNREVLAGQGARGGRRSAGYRRRRAETRGRGHPRGLRAGRAQPARAAAAGARPRHRPGVREPGGSRRPPVAGMSGAAVRATAAQVVDAVVTAGRALDQALAERESSVPAADRPLLHELAYGVLRRHWRLRAWLGELLDRPVSRKDRVIEALLAVGLYQLAELRVPDHAAVTLTVQAARLLGRPRHAGLVNAVLRNFRRRDLAAREAATEEARWNHPAWLIARLRRDWPDHFRQILEANDQRAPMWLRLNPRRTTLEAWQADLERAPAPAPFTASRLPGFEQAIRLDPARPVAALPGYADGRVSVQDAAAQIAAPWLLEGHGGGRILDACAAPGGKSAHLLELAPPGTELLAVDIDPERLERVRENLERLGLRERATLVAADA